MWNALWLKIVSSFHYFNQNEDYYYLDFGNSTSNNTTDPNHDHASNELDEKGLLDSMIISLCLCAAFTILFSIVRIIWKRFHCPRGEFRYNWIGETFFYPERLIFESFGGYDAVVYLRSLKYLGAFFAALSIISIPIFVPINETGHDENDSHLNRASMSNIPSGSKTLFVHVISVYLFSAAAYFFMFMNYRMANQLHGDKIKKDSVQNRTVMIENLPSTIRSNSDLAEEFNKLWDHKVEKANLALKNNKLRELQKKRKKSAKMLKRAIDYYSENNARPTKESLPLFGKNNKDLIETYEIEVENYDQKINQILRSGVNHAHVGFVTFVDVETAMICAQTLHERDSHKYKVRIAPEKDDIQWGNLGTKKGEKMIRKILVSFCVICLFLFWSIPVTFISALSNLETLYKVRGLRFLVNILNYNAKLTSLINGFLPSVALILFMNFLPDILTALFSNLKWNLKTSVDRAVAFYYTLFLILNVFLVSTITGSLFQTADKLYQSPSIIINDLGESLPTQAVFFMNFIIVEALTFYPSNLLRIPDFILWVIKWIINRKKPLYKVKFNKMRYFNYHIQYPKQALIFCIALTYSTMAPIILPFAMVYYLFSFFYAKHHFIHINTKQYEGEDMTYLAINLYTIGIFLYQLSTIGALALKAFPYSAFLFPLLIFTFAYRWYLVNRFQRSLQYMSLKDIKDLDDVEKNEKQNEKQHHHHRHEKENEKNNYKDPAGFDPTKSKTKTRSNSKSKSKSTKSPKVSKHSENEQRREQQQQYYQHERSIQTN